MARVLSAILAGAIAFWGVSIVTTVADPAAAQQAKKKQAEKPLRGVVRYKRVGGYSYSYQDSKMSVTESQRFWDPTSAQQSLSGPFDSGFFFDSANRRNGGDAPYPQ